MKKISNTVSSSTDNRNDALNCFNTTLANSVIDVLSTPSDLKMLLLEAVERNYSSHKLPAEQVLKLIQDGSVTYGDNRVNFHSVNGTLINKSLILSPYTFTQEKVDWNYIYKRDLSTDLLGRVCGQGQCWIKTEYLDKRGVAQTIEKEIIAHGQQIALWKNFFGPITHALEGSYYQKIYTIYLLININDNIIVDWEKGTHYFACDHYRSDSRRFLELNINCPGLHARYDHDTGAIYTYEDIF